MVKNSTKMKLRPVAAFIAVTALLLLLLSFQKFKDTAKPPQYIPMPTAIPTQETSATGTPTSVQKNPSDILSLSNWKLTLPLGPAKDAQEIEQPDFAHFALRPWYHVSSDGNSVIFRAPVNGSTTENSEYPRSELREMTNNGTREADWSTSSGTHTMTVDEAILAVPKTKRHIVATQIHDGEDDVIVIRLDYPNLYVNVDGKNTKVLDSSYQFGRRFTIKFEVENNRTHVYYNNSVEPVYTLEKEYSEAYFKAGAYTQSNCSKEKESLCNEDNYGEVAIYGLSVTHR